MAYGYDFLNCMTFLRMRFVDKLGLPRTFNLMNVECIFRAQTNDVCTFILIESQHQTPLVRFLNQCKDEFIVMVIFQLNLTNTGMKPY